MLTDIVVLIIFLFVVGIVVSLIAIGKSFFSRKRKGYLFVSSEDEGSLSDVASESYDEKSREITTATMGYNGCSVYYFNPDDNLK